MRLGTRSETRPETKSETKKKLYVNETGKKIGKMNKLFKRSKKIEN